MEDKELGKLVDKLFEADQLDSPSMGFTQGVMSAIEASKKTVFSYTPLLPKWVLTLVGMLLVVFVISVLQANGSNSEVIANIQFKDANAWFSNILASLGLSNVLGYSVLVLGIMVCFQAFAIRRMFGGVAT